MKALDDSLLVVMVLMINFMATILYLFLLSNEKRKQRFFSMPFFIQKLFIFLFVGPLFLSPFLPQARMDLGGGRMIAGILLLLAGFIMIVFAFFKIGTLPSLREKSNLITDGVYKIVRHPIYSGTILAFLGLILLGNAYIPLLYLPISILLYFIMTVAEEKGLVQEYGELYIKYQRNVTKRIIPFIL